MGLAIPTLDQVDVQGKRVLLRLDLNVPIKDGKVLDIARIEAALPTIRYLLEHKVKQIFILSHLGRPEGADPLLSLKQVVPFLEQAFGVKVNFESNTVSTIHVSSSRGESLDSRLRGNDEEGGEDDNISCSSSSRGQSPSRGSRWPGVALEASLENELNSQKTPVTLLENLRFSKEEEANDANFAKSLASLGDIYVNDAFSVSHRAHASVDAIVQFLPSYAGLHFQKEIEALDKVTKNIIRPLVIIIGGSKVSTKVQLLKNLVTLADHMIIGGAMAHVFLKAKGIPVGKSLVEDDYIDTAKDILAIGKDKIFLTTDVIAADSQDGVKGTYLWEKMPQNLISFDIGPKSLEMIKTILSSARTILWNGPLGYFEKAPFADGSIEMAKYISKLTRNKKIMSIAGGGDTLAVIRQACCEQSFSFVSTAGGAFLEYLEGKSLPGIVALMKSCRL